ncbi:MAG: cell wall anchor protein, partial [Muribaculaceae bacterium]|nr:cell wall anchor protein [Muribaculaceae bacterium]
VMLIIDAIALWLILKRRKKQAEAEAELPPYNWAMLKLKEIRERNMFSSGQERLYFTTLTEVLRIYLLRRFDINAMEMTSSQILASLPTHIPGVKEGKPRLKDVLQMADFVKFAKHKPSTDDNIRAFNNAVQFVELTRPLVDETASGDGAQETETTQESQSENTTLD